MKLSIAGLSPLELAVTPSGWVLMACGNTYAVYAFDPRSGQTHRIAGVAQTGTAAASVNGPALHTAEFVFPVGAAVLSGRPPLRLAVADSAANAIRVVTLAPFFATPPALLPPPPLPSPPPPSPLSTAS